MRKSDSSARNLQFSSGLRTLCFSGLTSRHLMRLWCIFLWSLWLISWAFCKELCHNLQGSLDSLSISMWFMWYWWFSGLFDGLGTKFYAFLQPKGEIGVKTRWKQRNPAKPKPSYPHLQLHHPSKACEPEQGPVSHPAVQQSSLASSYITY